MNRQIYFEEDPRRAALSLPQVRGLGPVLCKRLIHRFRSPAEIFTAELKDGEGLEGIGPETWAAIRSFKPPSEWIESELERVDQLGYRLLALGDSDYPEFLSAIEGPPPVLYLRGTLLPADRWAVAVVGSRRATDYGLRLCRTLTRGLVEKGFTILSGMARGIDQTAHRTALKFGGRTIGVMGCGLDVVYPHDQEELRDAVSGRGALLSEFPLGTPPDPKNFPQRNRVISGLSMGTLVVEAAMRSGSLITARLALGQGREVFAVPGDAGRPGSGGSNHLIKQGAKLVETLEDMMEEFSSDRLPPKPLSSPGPEKELQEGPTGLSEEEELVYKGLSSRPCHIDELGTGIKFSSSRIAGVLLQLELKGAARQLAGNFFIRT